MATYSLLLIVFFNLFACSISVICKVPNSQVANSDEFELKYEKTPFSLHFTMESNVLDDVDSLNNNCSYKLIKQNIITSSDDCSHNSIYNLEPETEYRLELEINYKGKLMYKHALLKTETLNFKVTKFKNDKIKYSSEHSYFDDNKSEICQIYDNDSGHQLRCENFDCHCSNDTITNLVSGKKYNIKIIDKKGRTITCLEIATTMTRLINLSYGLHTIGYGIDKTTSAESRDCYTCLFIIGTSQNRCCSDRVITRVSDAFCSGVMLRDLESGTSYGMQGCTSSGSEWFPVINVHTATRPIQAEITTNGLDVSLSATYTTGLEPDPCFLFLDGMFSSPATCVLSSGCTCSYGQYRLALLNEDEQRIMLLDFSGEIIYSTDGLITTPRVVTSPAPPKKKINSLNLFILIAIIIAILAVIVSISVAIFYIRKRIEDSKTISIGIQSYRNWR